MHVYTILSALIIFNNYNETTSVVRNIFLNSKIYRCYRLQNDDKILNSPCKQLKTLISVPIVY